MPIKVDKQALLEVSDKASLDSAVSRINSSLVSLAADSLGRVLFCTQKARDLSVPRGTKVLQDLTSAQQRDKIVHALENKTNACVCLSLRKPAYATLEYVSGGIFICYIFAQTKTIEKTINDELLHYSFALEYVRHLTFGGDTHCVNTLLEMLKAKVLRLTAYSKSILYAKNNLETHETDLNVFLQRLIEYINEFGNTTRINLNYHSNKHAKVMIDTGIFAKIFCASICYLSSQPQTESIPVDIRFLNKNNVAVCLLCHTTTPLQRRNAYLYFLLEIAPALGWKINLEFNEDDCQSTLGIEIPVLSITEDTLHSPNYQSPLSRFISDSQLCQALSML